MQAGDFHYTKKYVHFMKTHKQFSPFKNLKYDLPASIVVFLVAMPLCLGIALASGAPLFSGIIAGIVGGLVVSVVSGSPLGVSGPAAGLVVIVIGAIQQLGFEVFLVAVVLAGMPRGRCGALVTPPSRRRGCMRRTRVGL